MKKNLKIIGLALVIILAALWGWKKWKAYSQPLAYQDLTTQNPYDALARGTGGQVLNLDKGNMEQATGLMLQVDAERDFVNLWTAEGQPAQDSTEFKFLVDSGITELSIYVAAIKEFPNVKVMDPSGAEVKPNKKLDSKYETKLNFVSLKPGVWKLKIQAQNNLHIQIKAQSTLQIVTAGFVRRGGRPGHEGYFAYKGPLQSGTSEIVNVNMIGVPEVSDVKVKIISLSGRVLQETKADLVGSTVQAKIEIPKEAFRVLVEGKYKGNESFQRLHENFFNLGRKEMLEFKTQLEEAKDSENCKILTVSTHWSMLSAGKEPGSAVVMCVNNMDGGVSKLTSHLNFHVPVNSDRSELKTRLYSADYKKLTQDDCKRAQAMFARYPKSIKGPSEHQLTWSFECVAVSSEFTGVIEVTVK